MSTVVSIGGGILGAIFGRKSGITAASSTISGAGRVMKERREAAAAASELESLQAEMAELEKQLADDTQKIRDQYDPTALTLETVKLTPVKKNIQVTATGILWQAKA
jgi:phage host-nuclease inhibitor protein Gam